VKVARWQRIDGVIEAGIIHDDFAIPLSGGAPVDVLISGGLPTALAAGRALVARDERSTWRPLGSVRLVAPITPPAVREFVTFERHVEALTAGGIVPERWYDAPTFSFVNPHKVLGPHDTVTPPRSDRLDFALEVAVVIGAVKESDGRHLTVERATEHIFGYTIYNGWAARDLQANERDAGLGPGKGSDFGATVGPWIVTADEFVDRHDSEGLLDLDVEVSVNDRVVGRDSLLTMGWTFPEMIAYASRDSRVAPGDIFASGATGSGSLAALGRGGMPWLSEGDVVAMRVEGVGAIRNPVGAPRPEIPAVPPARSRREVAR
jgi:2-keto-4-pentenoate hydratase/2-oxohepta-3-ene-1,7-dioic acid hydratase in catechol pathway